MIPMKPGQLTWPQRGALWLRPGHPAGAVSGRRPSGVLFWTAPTDTFCPLCLRPHRCRPAQPPGQVVPAQAGMVPKRADLAPSAPPLRSGRECPGMAGLRGCPSGHQSGGELGRGSGRRHQCTGPAGPDVSTGGGPVPDPDRRPGSGLSRLAGGHLILGGP